ncbi:helix-turn-helix domain-containing protein [Pedobacter sp. B4-66]|uniref:helix-turn-helix domain-containing protein n=1 Tax=Pedobacter sp. B4-66 TaxID=2817280 RepID=UPI001BDAF3FF|nr:helix-turn-helix domain-containing protein [Pedobacter sp. B4-66]
MGSNFNEFSIMQSCAEISLWSYWDIDLICRFANKEFFKWWAKTPEELLGIVSLRVLLNGSYHEHHLPYVNKVLDGQLQKYQSEIKTITGEKCPVTIIYYPDIENGNVIGFFANIYNKDLSRIQGDNTLGDKFRNNPESGSGHDLTANKSHQIADYLGTVILTGFPTVEQLSIQHNISVSKLMRDFKATYQTSPYLYYRRLQMEFAEQYISRTGCSKKQMAFMLGFSNPANYTLCYNRYKRSKGEKIGKRTFVEDIYERNRIFIAQFPMPVAMFDVDMNYLLASEQWMTEFDLHEGDPAGLNFFDLFTEAGSGLEILKDRFSKGTISNCVGTYDFYNKGHLLKCIVNLWRNESDKINGVIIYVAPL